MARRTRGDDGRDGARSHATDLACLVLESRDLVKDMSQGLVLRSPVQEVIPIVAASHLLFTVDNTATKVHCRTILEYFVFTRKLVQAFKMVM